MHINPSFRTVSSCIETYNSKQRDFKPRAPAAHISVQACLERGLAQIGWEIIKFKCEFSG